MKAQFFGVFVLFYMAVANATDSSTLELVKNECDSLSIRLRSDASLGPAAMRARLLDDQRVKCSGGEIYSLSLAGLYQEAKLFDEADRVARGALSTSNKYRPNLLTILAADQLGLGNDDKAYGMALKVARQFPRFAPIYGVLGSIDVKRNRWDLAYQHDLKAVEIAPSAVSYMALATALYQLKRYTEVVETVDHALRLDPRRIANATGLTEGIYALMILHREDEARDLLHRHIEANPRWRESEAMHKAATHLDLE